MHKEEIIKILSNYKNEYAEKYGIQKIGFFGPIARDDMREDNDVDVVVNISDADLFYLSGSKMSLRKSYRNLLILLHTGKT